MAYGYVAAKIAAHTALKNGIPARKFPLPKTRIGVCSRYEGRGGEWTISWQGPEYGAHLDLLVDPDGTISIGNEEGLLYRKPLAKYKNYAAAARAIKAGELDSIAVKIIKAYGDAMDAAESIDPSRGAVADYSIGWAAEKRAYQAYVGKGKKKAPRAKKRAAPSKRIRQEADVELFGPSGEAEDAFFSVPWYER